MKLSMWMIANRLSSLLDMEIDIRWDAPAILNSARTVYSTNCVHVYQENDHVVCSGEGDRILFYNLSAKETFEIIQGVFDFYEDWEDKIAEAARNQDFQKILDQCWIVFQNPLILQDANYKVLAMSREPDIGDMDEEWNYLKTYGYSSLNSLRYMREEHLETNFTRYGHKTTSFKEDEPYRFGGISYNMQFNSIACGRMLVLEKKRKFNNGDFQLLERLAQYLEPILGASGGESRQQFNAFYALIFHKTYDEKELELQMKFQNWDRKDTYQLVLLQPWELHNQGFPEALHVLSAMISRQITEGVVITKRPYILLLVNRAVSEDPEFLNFLTGLSRNNPIVTAFSLPIAGLDSVSFLFRQAVKTIQLGLMQDTDERIFFFGNYGVNFILECNNDLDKIHACHPMILKLWKDKQERGDELYDTLKSYLDYERSLSRTAAHLYSHRNTILYRIHKCEDMLHSDLNDIQERYYIRLSMEIIERQNTVAGSTIPAGGYGGLE